MKINKEEFDEIEKLFAWALLSDSNAKFGKVFLTAHPEIKQCMINDGDNGIADVMILWAESDVEKARVLVKQWVK